MLIQLFCRKFMHFLSITFPILKMHWRTIRMTDIRYEYASVRDTPKQENISECQDFMPGCLLSSGLMSAGIGAEVAEPNSFAFYQNY